MQRSRRDRREEAGPPPRQAAHAAFQEGLERRDQRSRRDGWPLQKVMLGLAVSTLALGLAMLAIVTRLDVNRTVDVPPRLAMSSDGAQGQVQVLHAEPDLRWADLRLDGDCTPLLNDRPLAETPAAPVRAGDLLSCGAGETLQIHSSRERGDAILFQSTFPE